MKSKATDLTRALDQGLELTTLPAAGDVWWVDDHDDIRDENRLRVDPHQALRRIRELQTDLLESPPDPRKRDDWPQHETCSENVWEEYESRKEAYWNAVAHCESVIERAEQERRQKRSVEA